MTKSDFLKLLRKYWYVALLLVLIVCALGYAIGTSDKDTKQLLSEYGYIVILFWTFLEGETVVIIAGALSQKIGLEPWLIALSAFCGSFASDQLMFSLGKHKGADALRYFPKIAKNMHKASALFKKYDIALILGFRFVYGVRNITPIMLGLSGVTHKKFFFLNAIGAGVWALTFTYGGRLAGEAFHKVMEDLGHGILYLLLGLIAAVLLIWYLRARRTVKNAKDIAEQCREEAGQGMPPSPECRERDLSGQQNTFRDAAANTDSAPKAKESSDVSQPL